MQEVKNTATIMGYIIIFLMKDKKVELFVTDTAKPYSL